MNLPTQFLPSRRQGLIFQFGAVVLLLAGSIYYFWLALQTQEGAKILGSLLAAVLIFAPLPLLLFRIYSLLRGRYLIERDGIRLRWGLRSEDIPLPEVEWVRFAVDFPSIYTPAGSKKPGRLPLPWLRWPGAVVGVRHVEGLGPVEFVAADTSHLVLVATPQRIFAISPANPQGFMNAFNRIAELGSLSPLSPYSVYPTFLLTRVWSDRAAKALLVGGLVSNLVLLAWVGLIISTRSSIPLGFTPMGALGEPGPVERLLLLPVVAGLAYLVDLVGGLYLYPRPGRQPIAYLLWVGAVLQGGILLIAVAFLNG